MKLILAILFLVLFFQSFSQDTIKLEKEKIHHNFIINVVPNQYNKPLIGIANFAKGNHKGFQNSLFNWNQINFKGTQIGIINIIGGSLTKVQVGVGNFCRDSLKGIQIGIINVVKNRKGIQIGLINYSDTVTTGIVIGYISIVRKGYQAIEIGVSEMFPYNISYKIGLKRQYSSFNISGSKKLEYPVFGFGFGSIISLKRAFFINPDFMFQNGIFKSKQSILSLVAKLSYGISKKIHASAGPSLVWNRSRSTTTGLNSEMYSIYNNSINYRNNLLLGFRFSLTYNLKGI
jgi:hypothetical protein